MGSRRKKGGNKQAATPELNVMPFVDIFSMLNTFLLVSASFIGLGILEVQIPFLSNAPQTEEEQKPERTLNIRVDTEKDKIILTTLYTEPPEDKQVKEYKTDIADIERFHQEMISIKTKDPKSDKVTVFVDDDVKYDKMVLVLDAIKTLKENDPAIPKAVDPGAPAEVQSGRILYDKVVIGSVIL